MSQANRLTDNQEGLSYVQDLERKLELSMEVVKAVAHIGIDWGFGKYNWKNQSERLIYLGYNWSGNGNWHQFALVENPTVVWCEVLPDDLQYFEVTDNE